MNFDKMIAYTDALSRNNNRTWFHDNHKDYEEAKDDFLALLDVTKLVIAEQAPKIGDSLIFENSKNFMYRIPRDMRYSMGKEPYNPAFRAYFSPHKKDFLPLSYFLYVAFDGVTISTGAYPWETKQLNRLREHVAYNYEELDEIVWENDLQIYGARLKKTPRGFEQDHPAADWLKYKYMLCDYTYTAEDLRDFNSFAEATAKAVQKLEPLRLYLMSAFTDEIEDEDYDEDY